MLPGLLLPQLDGGKADRSWMIPKPPEDKSASIVIAIIVDSDNIIKVITHISGVLTRGYASY